MDKKIIHKKEAIVHGFKMTKKYLGFVLMALLIYILFQGVTYLLERYAGSDTIIPSEFRALYKDEAMGSRLNQELAEQGYFNKFNAIQPRLEKLKNSSELILSSDFNQDREKIYKFLDSHRYHLPFPKIFYYLLLVGLWFIYVLMGIGWVKISLKISRDEQPEYSELFSNVSLLIPYCLATICSILAILGGMILLIIPGIIIALAYTMFSYFIIDQNMGPIQALKASWKLTKGVRWQMFCFMVLLGLVNIAGALCLIVGLLFTVPASYVAFAYVYDQLKKQSEEVTVA